jgi:uncharacterized RDD family membrane protein YckC
MTVTAQPRMAVAPAARFGGFWIRVLAFFLDSIVIGVIVSLLSLGRAGLVAWDHWELAAWRTTIETLVGLVYFTVLWSSIGGGRTLGMRLLNLRVVGTDGRPIGLGGAVLRWIGIVISAAVVLLGLVWVAFDPRKQGWHDKLAGTVVIRDGDDGHQWTSDLPSGHTSNATVRGPRTFARGLAVGFGILGSGLAVLGIALAIRGDAVLEPGTALAVVAAMTVVAILGTVVVWWSPAAGGAALIGAAVVFGLAVGPLLGPWYDGLLAATAVGPSSETAYWFDAPAMALVFMAGIVLGLAGLLALAGVRRGARTTA